jgi:hypothetical protein
MNLQCGVSYLWTATSLTSLPASHAGTNRVVTALGGTSMCCTAMNASLVFTSMLASEI